MTAQAQSQLQSGIDVLPPSQVPRCPVCEQTLPDHVSVDDLEARLRERDDEVAKKREKRIRADIQKENAGKTEAAVAKALVDQRATLEEANSAAVNKVKSEAFEQNQQLLTKLADAQRQLERKNSNELGEGAEIDLYEALRAEYEDDRIKRVKKGEPGADIRHEVVHNGQTVGSIVYDSKNHAAWRNGFVDKLKKDQLAARADHAVLATSAFPAGARQLRVQDDVIIANPARVVELVRLIRQHMVQAHRQRLGAAERNEKTQALYEFIVSDRYSQLMGRFDTLADGLLNVDVDEVKAHNRVWRKRGQLLREVQKVHGDLTGEIDRILEGRVSP